jgi:hypothetical protein
VLLGLLASVSCALSPAVRAQEAENVITVHPSGIDPRNQEALSAQERLERRLKRSDQILRSICVGCGSRDAVAGAPPFSPMDVLHPSARANSQMLVQRQLPDEVTVEFRQVPAQPDAAPPPEPPLSGPSAPPR